MIDFNSGEKTEKVTRGNFKAADAFINLSIPADTESGKTKLGKGVALHVESNAEKQLVEWFNQAVEAGKEDDFNTWLKDQLIVEFRLGVSTGGAKVAETVKPAFLTANG